MPKNPVAEAFTAYRERLLKFIRSRVRGLEDAEDILQDVFYRFAQAEDTVEQTAAWLYRAARNRIIDRYRKKEDIPFSALALIEDAETGALADIMDILASDERTPETQALRTLVLDEIASAIDELPPSQREVFIQTELLNVPVSFICENAYKICTRTFFDCYS
ncbi:MAG: sigma-70 family RNA polymerase sigma factor [Treponema sp.]|jgi:RNA polymerase sigma factor (sigma-70 family)|nr:sigma-70 family RNA polymerase sigma factor [Treponema sp.]